MRTRLALERPADVVRHRLESDHVRYESLFDETSGVPGTALLRDRTALALARIRRAGKLAGAFVVDIGDMGRTDKVFVRDTLRLVAGRLRSVVRPDDTVARVSGSVFAVVCNELDDDAHAASIAGRLADVLRVPLRVGGHEFTLSPRVGHAVATHDVDPEDFLVEAADAVLTSV